jgi:rhodanese-related sulfurtransferase
VHSLNIQGVPVQVRGEQNGKKGKNAMSRVKQVSNGILALVAMMGLLLIVPCGAATQQTGSGDQATGTARIPPAEVYQKVTNGDAVLVCAYKQEAICKSIWIEGAVSLDQFETGLSRIKKDQAVIFYCGSGTTSDRVATTYRSMGYTNIMTLDGGIEAWKKAGYGVVEKQ